MRFASLTLVVGEKELSLSVFVADVTSKWQCEREIYSRTSIGRIHVY